VSSAATGNVVGERFVQSEVPFAPGGEILSYTSPNANSKIQAVTASPGAVASVIDWPEEVVTVSTTAEELLSLRR
jgi:hypothetical protein